MEFKDLRKSDIFHILQHTSKEQAAKDLLQWSIENQVFVIQYNNYEICQTVMKSNFMFTKDGGKYSEQAKTFMSLLKSQNKLEQAFSADLNNLSEEAELINTLDKADKDFLLKFVLGYFNENNHPSIRTNTMFLLPWIDKLLTFPEISYNKILQIVLQHNCFSVFLKCKNYLTKYNLAFDKSSLLDILECTEDLGLAIELFGENSQYTELLELDRSYLHNLSIMSRFEFVKHKALEQFLNHPDVTYTELNQLLLSSYLNDDLKSKITDFIKNSDYYIYTNSLL
jgi:hypothetical protein